MQAFTDAKGEPLDAIVFDGENAEEMIRHAVAAGAVRGGFHPGAPGDQPEVQIEMADGTTVTLNVGDVLTKDAQGVVELRAQVDAAGLTMVVAVDLASPKEIALEAQPAVEVLPDAAGG